MAIPAKEFRKMSLYDLSSSVQNALAVLSGMLRAEYPGMSDKERVDVRAFLADLLATVNDITKELNEIEMGELA
jgi:hypothetical protein